jgi:hypothetical protein
MAAEHMITDAELMAFADGALDEPRFEAVARAVESDPDLAARLEAIAAGGRMAHAVFAPLADLPVPARLERAVRQAARPQAKRGWWPGWLSGNAGWPGMALAAGLAAVIAVPAGYFLAGSPEPAPAQLAIGTPLAGPLADALDGLASGSELRLADGSTLRPIATFTDAADTLCREFERDAAASTVAIACREGGAWQLAFAIEAPLGADGYAPASALSALDAYLEGIEAGPPLPAEAEAEALAALR